MGNRAKRAPLEEIDHAAKISHRTCHCCFSQRRCAGPHRRFGKAVGGGWGFGGGFHHHHHFGIGYGDDGCFVTQPVLTPLGYRLRFVNICAY